MIEAVAVTAPRFELAEGPLWDAGRRRLLWVDILDGLVVVARLDGDVVTIETEHHFDGCVGAVAVTRDGAMLVAETRDLTVVSPDGARRPFRTMPGMRPQDRLNDGICDKHGRFLVGTLSRTNDHRDQRLLQVGPGGTVVIDDDLGLSNGLAFSPDGATLYSVDSVPGTVWRRDYDHRTGALGPRSVVLDLSDETPDGLAVDADGHLWIAMWGAGEVRCHTATGELRDTIRVAAPHTSSVAFVGEDLDQIVITTARSELTDSQLEQYPLSGSLFLARAPCRGLPAHPWTDVMPIANTSQE